jgi:hypothetical protein
MNILRSLKRRPMMSAKLPKYFYVKAVSPDGYRPPYLKRYEFKKKENGYIHGYDPELKRNVCYEGKEDVTYYDKDLPILFEEATIECKEYIDDSIYNVIIDFRDMYEFHNYSIGLELERNTKEMYKRVAFLNNVYNHLRELEKEGIIEY